jgi:hypothetical protein
LLEDTEAGAWCLGHQQLFAQMRGGGSPERGKINELVGQLSGRHRQKCACTAWLELYAQGRYHSGCIDDRALRIGTGEHSTMKALELIVMWLVGDSKCIMAQIDHYRHLAIGKTAFLPGGECCISFIEGESLHVCRKGRLWTKVVQDSQDQTPIDGGSFNSVKLEVCKIFRANFHLQGVYHMESAFPAIFASSKLL